MKKRILSIIGVCVVLILIPLLMDGLILGNKFPSNISNDTWAGFFGSYIGGIATMLAVYVTIADNNRKAKEQREEEANREKEQRRLSIKPYLDTRTNFFDHTIEVGSNDRVFELDQGSVKYMRYYLPESDRKRIEALQNTTKVACIKHSIRNIGAGSAVDFTSYVNGYKVEMAIAKDESVNFYYYIWLHDEEELPLEAVFDFWDTEARGHYHQEEKMLLKISDSEMVVEPIEKRKAVEI